MGIRGLEHHRSSADDRVQLDLEGSRQACERRYVLEALGRHRHHAHVRLPRRDLPAASMACLHYGYARLVLHSLRDLCWRSWRHREWLQRGPLGYLFGYLLGSVDETFLNVLYNIADFVNKIAFVLACWSSAKAESEGKKDVLLA